MKYNGVATAFLRWMIRLDTQLDEEQTAEKLAGLFQAAEIRGMRHAAEIAESLGPHGTGVECGVRIRDAMKKKEMSDVKT